MIIEEITDDYLASVTQNIINYMKRPIMEYLGMNVEMDFDITPKKEDEETPNMLGACFTVDLRKVNTQSNVLISSIELYYKSLYEGSQYLMEERKDKEKTLYIFMKLAQFVLLHEFYHLYLYLIREGERTSGDIEEEIQCDMFTLAWFRRHNDLFGAYYSEYSLQREEYDEDSLIIPLNQESELLKLLFDEKELNAHFTNEKDFFTLMAIVAF